MGALRPRHVKGTSALDVILKAFLKNDLDNLDQKHKDILERITEVDKRIRVGNVVIKTKFDYELNADVEDFRFTRPYRKRELAEWQMARFGVSLAQAYADIEMAERFFLTTETRQDKEFARGMQIYWGEEAMARAQHDGDHRAAAMFYKELNRIRGLDRPDDDTVDLQDWRPIKPVVVSDPSQLGFEKIDNPDKVVAQLRKELRGKSNAIERMLDAEASDVDFEEEGDDVGGI